MIFLTGLKSRRARKVVPVQDLDMNQLMQKYGVDSDSDESADEDFSPTNVESNSKFITNCGFELLAIH